jgi:hypothetical protein
LLIPAPWSITPTFPDYATAAAFIAASVSDCDTIYSFPGADLPGTFTSSFDGTTYTAAGEANASFEAAEHLTVSILIAVSMASGDVLSLAFTNTGDGDTSETLAQLVDCATGDIPDSDTSASGSGTLTLTAPDDGIYYVRMNGSQDFGGSNFPENTDVTWSVTSSAVWILLPVIALWDDSGTTRKLWACPKLLLPPLTELTGDWYASCADAHAVLSDALQVSNCVGFTDSSSVDSFTATDGGSSLTLAGSTSGGTGGLDCWGGISLAAAGTITATFSNALGGFFAVYDDTGTLVQNFLGAGPFTTGTLPPGRYTLNTTQSTDMTHLPGNVVITASVTMTVNTIQARWDASLTCAALLDCGDSCP